MRDLGEGDDPQQAPERVKPGLLAFRGWGLERQLSAERRAYIDALRADIEAMKKEHAGAFSLRSWRDGSRRRSRSPRSTCAAARSIWATKFRGISFRCLSSEPVPLNHGSGRLDLAEQIVKQPIAMRVIVNRVWRAHFGTGIVDTPSNFGIMGERPTNPELLEYLAKWFVDNGMSVKKLHREILLSAVYQLSDEGIKENLDKDPANRFYWRANRHRMDAEQIRDSILAAGGRSGYEDRRAVRAAEAGIHAPHRVWKSEPVPAGRISAAVRFSEPESLGRKAFRHHRASAAAVLHE